MRIENDFWLPAPTLEKARRLGAARGVPTEEMFNLLVEARAEQIEARRADPFRYGFVPKVWTVVWSLLDFPFWPKNLEREALEKSGEKDLWGFMRRMREALGFEHRVRMVWISGANRSGKSEFVALTMALQMVCKPGSLIVPMSATEDQSRSSDFQDKIHRYIPHEWQDFGRKEVGYVSYKKQTGFGGNGFILPNGSECKFRFYAQDASTAGEGWSADMVCPDETIPADWFHRIAPRISAKDGVAILTNTPQSGYSDVVHEFMNGMTVTRWATGYMLPKDGGDVDVCRQIGLSVDELASLVADHDARPQRPARVPECRPEDCWRWMEEAGKDWRSFRRRLNEAPSVQEGNRLFEAVPRVGKCEDPDKAVVFFFGSDNPFGMPRNLLGLSALQDRDWTRCRVYGVVSPSQRSVFVQFRRGVHVVKDADVPTDGTRYMVLDPAFTRNGFMLWCIVKGDTMWVYREFPSGYAVPGRGVPGPWAKTSGKKGGANDGEKDEGAASFGWGYLRYKNLIARLEGWHCAGGRAVWEDWDEEETVRGWRDSPFGEDSAEPIRRRIMDPRGGSAPTVQAKEVTSPLLEYVRIGMRFAPAFSGSIVAGVDAIANALDWGAEKRPRLFVAESCKNLIWALENWKNLDGEKGATKDPIDCLRYLFTSGCVDVGDRERESERVGGESRWSAGGREKRTASVRGRWRR